METFSENWEAWTLILVAAAGNVDTVMCAAIKSLGNIRDTWNQVFPKFKVNGSGESDDE